MILASPLAGEVDRRRRDGGGYRLIVDPLSHLLRKCQLPRKGGAFLKNKKAPCLHTLRDKVQTLCGTTLIAGNTADHSRFAG